MATHYGVTGWYKDAFILPDVCIGSDKYYFQSESYNANIHYQQQGTLEEWQANVAKYCIGNPLLMLSMCTAFMGALLKPTHQEGGGFHIYGDSSKGKSTGMAVASSVFGDETFKQSWRATSNGLEAAAAMANDSLLALDEISECDPNEIGKVVYLLANGSGKQRANKNGGARDVTHWRIAVLSNGERSTESAMLEAGKKAKAGQFIRLLNIPLFGEHGAFNELHDKVDGRALADHLQTASSKYYGVAGIEYLTKMVAETIDLDKEFNDAVNELIGDEELSDQEARGAKRFALAALAGEMATHYGVTGWEAGDASRGVKECFIQWRADFGKGDIEDGQCLQAVKDFIDKHGDARFSLANGEDKYIIHNRAGYYIRAKEKDTPIDKVTYLFNDAGFDEATKDSDRKRTLQALEKHGWLETQGVRNKKEQRINGTKSRFYFITLPDEA
ncbi:inner membrane protein [methanotrophic bacterial endosymbiont of Bathymodiolus sp.]|nr:inner membrane protein [methanotrophic bacterial endosymbiont of Bathymodiolus sp.]